MTRFKDSKGCSFIKQDGGGDALVRFPDIQMGGHRTLERGQLVEALASQGSSVPRASGVVFLYIAEERRWARLYT